MDQIEKKILKLHFKNTIFIAAFASVFLIIGGFDSLGIGELITILAIVVVFNTLGSYFILKISVYNPLREGKNTNFFVYLFFGGLLWEFVLFYAVNKSKKLCIDDFNSKKNNDTLNNISFGDMPSKYCANCGNPIDNSLNKFCTECGKQFNNVPGSQPSTQ